MFLGTPHGGGKKKLCRNSSISPQHQLRRRRLAAARIVFSCTFSLDTTHQAQHAATASEVSHSPSLSLCPRAWTSNSLVRNIDLLKNRFEHEAANNTTLTDKHARSKTHSCPERYSPRISEERCHRGSGERELSAQLPPLNTLRLEK